tara:strand:+ start:436 stop:591 length:156 start_codon:yes stop_codon:yes gene_type:complete
MNKFLSLVFVFSVVANPVLALGEAAGSFFHRDNVTQELTIEQVKISDSSYT